MTRIKDVIRELEAWAPPSLAADYDNVGLLVGDTDELIKDILVSLDCTEAVVDEAIRKNCNLIVSHHPIVFKGLKRFNGNSYVERVVIKAIQNNIALYAIHTNLDSIENGVNGKIADLLDLKNQRVLQPSEETLQQLTFFVPEADAENVRIAIHSTGAGEIGKYSNCSFNVLGKGIYRPEEGAVPHLGEIGSLHSEDELRVELIYPKFLRNQVIQTLKEAHPYEEVAYYEHNLINQNPYTGAGMVGDLSSALEPMEFLDLLKHRMKLQIVKYTALKNNPIKKVALCGGSGSFLLKAAKRKGADVFVSADFKYHDYFDAVDTLPIIDIGHYESERFTVDLLGDFLRKKFSTFATHLTEVNTNPIQYY